MTLDAALERFRVAEAASDIEATDEAPGRSWKPTMPAARSKRPGRGRKREPRL